MLTKQLFQEMSLDLKADYVHQKGSFVAHRIYGNYKMSLYKTDKFYLEYRVLFDEIMDIVILELNEVKRFYKRKLDSN